MKKIIYKLIFKYPLIILLLKTPLKKFFINYMRKFRYRKKTNLLDELLSYFFWIEYFSKLENPEEIRKITNSTLDDGEGRRWAEDYFRGHFKTIENLHNTKFGNFGLMTLNDANPIYSEIIKYIKDNHLSEDKDTFIIQIGSSSGMDLKFFYDQFPKLNYISTDVNDEILNFQKEKYDFPNFKFFKCYAEEIDKCFEQFNLDLYYSTLINDTLWSESYNIGSVINGKSWESQPCISADGSILFFVSNRYGGYGGSDIWMSKKNNNTWSKPINLGPKINTPSDEYTPFLHYDNETFYFASKGHNGFGGFDLYVAQLDSLKNVTHIVNLGYPINTHYDESGLIVSQDGLKAYYNSNISGDLDIYEFNLPYKFQANSVAIVNGVIIDSVSRDGVSCYVSVSGSNHDWTEQIVSDGFGEFSFSIPKASSFSITTLSDNHDFFSSEYKLEKNEYLKNIQIVLNRLNIGNKMNLDNIYYKFDDYSLQEESLIEIKKFSNYLILNNNLIIEISGHTDNIGSLQYNYQLSKNRAKSVYEALVFFGVNPNQLTYKGYGYDFPVSTKDTEEDRLTNRRTEIKVIGSSYGK